VDSTQRHAIFSRLRAANPQPASELEYRSPFELLVAVMLSAQATDKSVNLATRELFQAARTPQAMLALGAAGLERYIRSIGLYRTKAKNIIATCKLLLDRHGGDVPRTREALEQLPGVGRKTANVVRGTAFELPAIFVDTHVGRLANRLGLTLSDDPEQVEEDLGGLLPPRQWTGFAHRLIHHGRRICAARKPRCSSCPIARWCPQIGVTPAA